MNLLPADIHCVHFGTFWMPTAPAVWLVQGMFGPYHIELVWEQIDDERYKVLTMQPLVLSVVTRYVGYVKGPFFRLIDRPTNMDELLYGWANEKIGNRIYGIHGACGFMVRDSYKDMVNVALGRPFPGPIEDVCKHSGKFVEVL